jgi:hypothetical protein
VFYRAFNPICDILYIQFENLEYVYGDAFTALGEVDELLEYDDTKPPVTFPRIAISEDRLTFAAVKLESSISFVESTPCWTPFYSRILLASNLTDCRKRSELTGRTGNLRSSRLRLLKKMELEYGSGVCVSGSQS